MQGVSKMLKLPTCMYLKVLQNIKNDTLKKYDTFTWNNPTVLFYKITKRLHVPFAEYIISNTYGGDKNLITQNIAQELRAARNMQRGPSNKSKHTTPGSPFPKTSLKVRAKSIQICPIFFASNPVRMREKYCFQHANKWPAIPVRLISRPYTCLKRIYFSWLVRKQRYQI